MPRRTAHKRPPSSPLWLTLIGIGLILIGLYLGLKLGSQSRISTELEPGSPQDVYQQALRAGQPMFVFFHSTDCHSCMVMMERVAEVYPSYAAKVVLVDVIVSEWRNRPLMEQFGLRAIPTMVFIDQAGKATTVVGPMEAEQLIAVFEALSAE
ncbi:MAG: hypothetical protein Kow0088_05080 [Anaerolineales bacterium]